MVIEHFDELYRRQPDPFDVGTSWYERRKIAVALAMLQRPRYSRVWDAAAGTGHLAEQLLPRCDHLVATDASEQSCRLLSERLPTRSQVRRHVLPEPLPDTMSYDLVVLSEVLYYLPPADIAGTAETVLSATARAADAECLVVSWRHHPDDAQVSGAESLELFAAALAPGFTRVVCHEEADFVAAGFLRDVTTGRPS